MTLKMFGCAVLLGSAVLVIIVWPLKRNSEDGHVFASEYEVQLKEKYQAKILESAAPPEKQAVREAINAAAGYLVRFNREDGRFQYTVNLNPDIQASGDYNMVRHAGAIYALGMVHYAFPIPQYADTMKKAATYLINCCMDEPTANKPTTEFWSQSDLLKGDDKRIIKLGSVGLGLVALSEVHRTDAKFVDPELLAGLAKFGALMQTESGEFYSFYLPQLPGLIGLSQDAYFPGEMALGWLKYYEIDDSDEWVTRAIKALVYLAKSHLEDSQPIVDHWSVIATNELFKLADARGLNVPRKLLIDNTLLVCDAILERIPIRPMFASHQGSLDERGSVVTTASSLEALMAAMELLPDGHWMKEYIGPKIHAGVGFILRAQIKGGEYDGGIPFAMNRLPFKYRTPQAQEFNKMATEIRIDYVQHALSAMVQYYRWKNEQ